jgi:hypothetical protein
MLSIQHTGLGYEYLRCRAAGSDDTVYVHQLLAIADGADPSEVFRPHFDVHHRNHVPWDNRPENLRLEPAEEHRRSHLGGRGPA